MVQEVVAVEVLLYALAGIALFFGSIFDLKTREVPDWLSYGLMFAGLGVRLMYSLTFFEWTFFFSGLVGFLIFVALGYLMFYSGQWGGGDAKLLMGLGAVFGFSFSWSPIPLIAVFFMTVLLVGGIYGLLWITGIIIRKHDSVGVTARKLRSGTSKSESIITIISSVLLTVLIIVWLQGFISIYGLLLAAIPLLSYYGWVLVKSVEKVAFMRKVLPQHLTEGDWVVDDIIVGGQRICGPSDLGLEKEQIAKLMHLHSQGKIDRVLIKDGIPFVPSFFIAFIIVIVLKNFTGLL